jgi:outer membrane protein TolC
MRILLGLVTLAGLACGPAACQTPPSVLTLDDCIRLAQSAQSSVSLARHESQIARYGITEARAGFLPQARWANGFTYNSPLLNATDTFSFIALNGIREYTSQAGATMELDTSGRLRAAMARARADQDAAAANLGLSQRDLKRAVTAGYYRLLLARHLVEATRASLDEAVAFEKRSELLAQRGEAARADVVKASAEAASLEQSLNAAELDAQLANNDLASFWTTATSAPLNIADVFNQPPPPPEDSAETAPYLRRLEFRLLDAQSLGFKADSRKARAALFPQLALEFDYGIDSTHVRIADRGYAAFATLNVPLFDWFRARSTARQFDLHAQEVETARAMGERTFSRDYQNALARVKLIYRQISLAESQRKASEEDLRLSRVRYEGGEGSALDVVDAQSRLTAARGNYYAALANYFDAKADLEVAKGQ